MNLTGIFPALATPLFGDDQVDEAGLRRLVRYVLAAKVTGVLVNGSMGGFAVLTDEEQLRAVSIAVSEVGGAVPVLAGLGETGTRRALRKAEGFAAAGADYLTVLPPFYMRPNQQQLFSFYSDVAANSGIPMLIYDNPVHTKCHIHPETVARLCASQENIVGIKESNDDCQNLQELIHRTSEYPHFSVLTGSESLLLVGLRMGCHGGIGGLFNVCPRVPVELWEQLLLGNIERAQKLQRLMIEIAQIFHYGAIWGGFDEAMRLLGICERTSGKPYATVITEQEAEKIRQILDQHMGPYLALWADSSAAAFQLEKASG